MQANILIEYKNKDLLSDWDRLSKLSRDEVVAIEKEWNEVYKQNQKLAAENLKMKEKIIAEIVDKMKESGIEVYKYKKTKHKIEKNGYVAWFNTNVVKSIENTYKTFVPSIPKFTYVKKPVNGTSVTLPSNILYLLEGYDEIVKQLSAVNGSKNINPILLAALDYAKENEVDIEGLSDIKIIDKINEVAGEKYLEKECPKGTEVYLDGECDCCEQYIVGDTRCSCGNRRIYIELDGNFITGFFWYPMGY